MALNNKKTNKLKTQYILRIGKFTRSIITENPEQIYWNSGLQKIDDNINYVSLYTLFVGTNTKTVDELDMESLEQNAYPIEIDELSHLTMVDFRNILVEEAEKEINQFEIYADHHKLAETQLDRYYAERGKLIKVLDFTAY